MTEGKIIEPNYLAGSTLFHITHHGAALGSASLTSARLRLVGLAAGLKTSFMLKRPCLFCADV